LVDEWTPEPLVEAPTGLEQTYINKIPVIAGYVAPQSVTDGKDNGAKDETY